MAFIEPCFGIGHNLSLICQMTSEDIKHQLIIMCVGGGGYRGAGEGVVAYKIFRFQTSLSAPGGDNAELSEIRSECELCFCGLLEC